jgi:SHR-binding domain of vacuolar-sorting associated protein 13
MYAYIQIVAVVPRYVMVNHLSQSLEVCQASSVITSLESTVVSPVVIPSKGQTAFHWTQPIRKKQAKQVYTHTCTYTYTYIYIYAIVYVILHVIHVQA